MPADMHGTYALTHRQLIVPIHRPGIITMVNSPTQTNVNTTSNGTITTGGTTVVTGNTVNASSPSTNSGILNTIEGTFTILGITLPIWMWIGLGLGGYFLFNGHHRKS